MHLVCAWRSWSPWLLHMNLVCDWRCWSHATTGWLVGHRWEWHAPKLDLIYNPEVSAAAASLDPLATEEDLSPEEPGE